VISPAGQPDRAARPEKTDGSARGSWAVIESVNPLITHKYFLFYHKHRISELTSGGKFNLFIPTKLGGLGFPRPTGLSIFYSETQRKLASFLLSRWNSAEGTLINLSKLNFRSLKAEVLMKEPAMKDHRVFKTAMIPLLSANDKAENIYNKNWLKPSDIFKDFTWSMECLYPRGLQGTIPLEVTKTKRSFWKQFNLNFSRLEIMEDWKLLSEWVILYVPLEDTVTKVTSTVYEQHMYSMNNEQDILDLQLEKEAIFDAYNDQYYL